MRVYDREGQLRLTDAEASQRREAFERLEKEAAQRRETIERAEKERLQAEVARISERLRQLEEDND